MATYVLGVSCIFHDAAATLLKDGEVVFASQEERYTRNKNDPRWPENAIDRAMEWSRISPADIDLVVYYENPWIKFPRVLDTYMGNAPRGFGGFAHMLQQWTGRNLKMETFVRQCMGKTFCGRIAIADHHGSHAAAAFFPSPFQRSAILTLDAVGEWETASIGVGVDNDIQIIRDQSFPHSIGMLYSAFTYFVGFKVNEGEYKLMGLAPYGTPRYADLIRQKIVFVADSGAVKLDMSYFGFLDSPQMTNRKFHELFGMEPRKSEDKIDQRHMDLAASIQEVCEEVVLKSARHAYDVTGEKNLVMAGGVALNCVANGRLMREGPFEQIWVQPSAGDAGGALGAALLGWHHLLAKPRTAKVKDSQSGSLLGDRFSPEECRAVLHGIGAVFDEHPNEDELLSRVVQALADGRVVGWFQGRMEYGPRALGSRSILGDPRPLDMQSRINQRIKFRESFRPFAPTVLQEYADRCFQIPEHGLDSPYMLFVYHLHDEWREALTAEEQEKLESPDLMERLSVRRSKVPAITHVDYSARIQTVDEERHGRYYRLLRRFYAVTGCPIIVNTSFNVANEPIVSTPEDAYHCLLKTNMDCLVVENCFMLREQQPPGLIKHILEDY